MSKIIMYVLSGEDFDPLQKEFFVYESVEDAKEAAEEYAAGEEGWLDYQMKSADITIEELVAEDAPEGFQAWQCSPFYDEKIPDMVEWCGEEIKVEHTGTAKTKIFGEPVRGKTVYDYSEYDCAIESGFIEHDRGNERKKAENLRAWLASSGLSQSEFARQINAPLRTVQNWCGGQREMSNFVYFLIKFWFEHREKN